MKKKGKETRGKEKEKPRQKGRLPKEVLALLEQEGLRTDTLLAAVTGDMDNTGEFCARWAAFDEQGLYFATGSETVVSKKGSKKLKTDYRLHSLETVPIGDYDELKTERYVSTGRLIGKKNGEDCSLTLFSIGFLKGFEDFCKTYNTFKSGKPLENAEQEGEERKCEKCGMPIPNGFHSCPKCADKNSTIKRLFAFFGGYKKEVAVVIVSMLIGTGISLIMPKISTQMLFDDVINKAGTEPAEKLIRTLGLLVLGLFGVRFLNTLFSAVYQYIIGGIMPRVIYDIKQKIFVAMQRLSVGFYASKQTGSIIEHVNRDANNIYWFFVDGLPYVLINSIMVIGVTGFLFSLSVKLTLLVLLLVPMIVLTLVFGGRFFRKLHHRFWIMNARVSSMASDNINGQRIIKAFSKEVDEYDRFAEVSGKLKGAELKLALTEATVFPILYLVIIILSTVLLAFGSMLVVRGEMTTGELLTYIMYVNMLQGPIDFLSWVSNWWARCVNSAQRVFEIVDSKPDVLESETPVMLEQFCGAIEISELVFEYEPARPVIKKLDLSVREGEMLGIVGKTGAGKTTIANLIARLYDAKEGSVKIDGVDVKDLSMKQLRSNVGLVSQDIYLFIGTIADNIRYAKPDANLAEVIAAAKAASAHDFIMKLPDGYDTRVGSGGQDLSGGERQRVSIARTIIQNPKILILDEATAAMDTATERNIQESLTRLKSGRTTIAIAHRLSTLRDADRLAVIDEGRVVEHGTFVELIKAKKEFFKLYKIQTEALKSVGIVE
ncbi:MAG: ABC transporter ATP-binding protein/permease [Oscillospiraceae bacterium]|jgi:ATP-binding cassette subfamily B protein|nr:ABC transporter ATP-binding protein/permease [Oscillospiraceae bacterium]